MNLGGMAKRDGIILYGDGVTVTAIVEKEEITVTTKESEAKRNLLDINIPFLRGLARSIDLLIKAIKSSPKIFGLILLITIAIPLLIILMGGEVNVSTETNTTNGVQKLWSIILILVMFQATDIGKFHAGEHMVIAALEKGLEPTIENVENGKKKVPDGWFEKLVEHYKLKGEEAKKLEEAIEESKTKVKIELAECDDYRKRTALAFQRSFYDLSENQTKRILEILEEGDK